MSGAVMLLIDADNVSVDVMEQAVHLLVAEHGALHVRRAYCTAESAMKHQATFKRLGIRPMVNLAAGKNSTDIAMAIDALELAIAERPAVVVIASSDSDFAPLVTKLREKGCRVVGIGQEGKTGDETRAVYDSFTVLAHRGGRQADAPAARPSRSARPARKAASRARPAPAAEPAATAPSPRAAATGERKGLPPPPRRRGRGGRAAAAPADTAALATVADVLIEPVVPVEVPAPPVAPVEVPAPPPTEAAAPAPARKAARTAARKTPRRKAPEAAAVEAEAAAPPPPPAAVPAPKPVAAATPAPAASAGPSPADVDRALAILKAVPGLADGATVELGVAAERLREAGLLGRGGSSTRLFGQFPTLFELRPAARPNHVRLRDGALD